MTKEIIDQLMNKIKMKIGGQLESLFDVMSMELQRAGDFLKNEMGKDQPADKGAEEPND